jgi:hypothetical protein
MSQFLIVISKGRPVTTVENVTFLPLTDVQNLFVEVSDFYGLDIDSSWAVLDENMATSEIIFTDAALDLSQADPLSKTDLGQLLGELIYSGSGLISWYGSEFQNLDEYNNIFKLAEDIRRTLSVGSGELYFTYAGG